MPLTQDQLERVEELLMKDRRRAVRALTRHSERFAEGRSDEDRFAFSLHLADQGSGAMERETAFLFASEEGRRLAAIDHALRSLYNDADSFGHCEDCGAEIAFARLEAVPYAERCIGCQREQEAGR